jgi:urease alpha subunit
VKEALAANPAALAADAEGAAGAGTGVAVGDNGSATATAMAVDLAPATDASDASPPYTAPAGRGQAWLEGVLLTVIQAGAYTRPLLSST